jgi:hypothetical protein
VAAVLNPSSAPASAPAPTATPAQATPTPAGYVTRAMMGDDWPLTVDAGQLACNAQGHVTFASGGVTYAVNGTAKGAIANGAPYQPIDTIWLDDPNVAGLKLSLQPLLDIGLSLCK